MNNNRSVNKRSIPNAKIPKVEIPPPVKISKKPINWPPWSMKLLKATLSIPGIGIYIQVLPREEDPKLLKLGFLTPYSEIIEKLSQMH